MAQQPNSSVLGAQAQPGPSSGVIHPNHRRDCQLLLQTLKLPKTPEQQQQILQILKNNPQLMAAFIKKRQMAQQPNSSVLGAQAQPRPSSGVHPNYRRDCQLLLQTLKLPKTPEQQQQILQILKNNPQLMAAFIKKRHMYQHRCRMRINASSSAARRGSQGG